MWVGMINLRPGPDGSGGAFAYCAARADSLAGAVAKVAAEADARGFEILALDRLSRYDDMPETARASEAVRAVVAALGDGDAALDHFYTYPELDEPDAAEPLKARVAGFVDGWIEDAVENCGPFELGDFAFVAEMRFPDDEELELGFAYDGDLDHAPGLFARAAEVAEEDDDD